MFLRAGDLDVHLQASGPPGAPPLLLLHSLGTSLHVWDAQAEALSASFRVLRPDLRGHGLTTATPGPYDIAALADDALVLLDALGVRHAHVAGISVGGMIAQALAARAAGRVDSLLLLDTAMAIPPPENWHARAAMVRAQGTAAIADAVMARWVTPGFLSAPPARGLRAMLLRTDPEGYAATAEAIAAADLTTATAALRVPTLVLVGDCDEATPLASAEALRDAIPGAQLEVIPGAAHIPTVEQPEAVTAAMRRFLLPKEAALAIVGDDAPDALAPLDAHAAGMAVRRAVLGEAHVARASAAVTALDAPFQDYITRSVWGAIWTRPGLPRHTRSLLTLAMMAALGREGEFVLHVRATRNTGVTPEQIAEVLLQVGAYAGVPVANHALKLAKQALAEMEEHG